MVRWERKPGPALRVHGASNTAEETETKMYFFFHRVEVPTLLKPVLIIKT